MPGHFDLHYLIGQIDAKTRRELNKLVIWPRMDSPGAGLGLPLIANVTDSFSVTELPEGGTEVCMTFPLRTLAAA